MSAAKPTRTGVEDDYCRQKAGSVGSTTYYCLRFSPPRARRGLTALYALKQELDEVVEECTELGVAERKLDFWAHNLQHLFAESRPASEAEAGHLQHPVMRGLSELVGSGSLRQTDLTAILAATHDRLRTPQILSESELMQICQLTAGQFARIGLRHMLECRLTALPPWSIGDETKARDAGDVRSEGKDYEVQDGDTMEFRFNV